jgi:hypothetical protein
MRKLYIISLLCFSLFENVFSQSIYFNKRIDVFGDWEVCRGIIPFNNGYLVAGGKGPGQKIYLSQLDSVGNIKWSQIYTEAGYNYFFGLTGSLFLTSDKYILICGNRAQYYGFGILIKVDSLGNRKWEKEYRFLRNTVINSGTNTKDSGFILTGNADTISPRLKYLLIKTDKQGNTQWYQTYTDNDPNRNYEGNCVIQTPDSGYCIGGKGGYHPFSNIYYIAEVIKTDSIGNLKWKKTFGDPLKANWGTMLALSNDSCIIAAYCIAYSSLEYCNYQLYLAKIGLDGNEEWNKKIGFVAPDNWPSWIQKLDDGSFILSGSRGIKDTVFKHIGWLFKLNKNCDSLWYREYAVIHGKEDVNELWQVTSTPDKGFAAAGSLFPEAGNGGQDIWVFKTDSIGCLVPNCDGVSITEFNPASGVQMLIYPNPFTNAFAINYNIPKENKKAVFQLCDIYGKLVYQIGLNTSMNQLQVVASSLKPGIYFASLLINGAIINTEKLIKN